MTAVDHAELKLCPFCGSAAKLETYGDRLGISCTECFCRTPLCQPGEDPLPIWNLRTQAPDSWRPDFVDVKAMMIEAYFSGWEDGSCGEEYDAWTAAAESERLIDERALVLRPQTAESGK